MVRAWVLDPGESRVADLTFRVFDRTLHPDWFATREFRRIEQLGWEADLRIIDGGHAVVFRSGTIRLAEILSGPETALPEAGLVFHSHLRRERSAVIRPGGGIEYQNCLEVERVDLEIFRHLCEEIRLDGSRHRMYSQLPVIKPPGAGRHQPRRRHAAGERPLDPVVSHISRRVRDRADPVVVRA